MASDVAIRAARPGEGEAISRLVNTFAAEGLMLRRTQEMVELTIHDYMVAVDGRGNIVACCSLKEYSPSLGEIAALAVSPERHGNGVGKAIVRAVEELALKRGVFDVFALTLQPEFFSAVGYERVDRARYPEKIRRDCLSCTRRFACNETCFAKNLRLESLAA